MTTPITPDLIRAALAHIPATLQRDDWARVGMAIQSEFPDDTGLGLFTDWSATAEGFNVGDVRSTWRSFKAGAVKIGTLLRLAIAAAPISQADKLRETDRLIWRPKGAE